MNISSKKGGIVGPTNETGDAGRRPSLVEVARLAGVSHITVSRVINDSAQVRPSTKVRVLEAMRDLGYQPNSAARALVTGKSRIIGVICYNTALYGPSAALLGLERTAARQNYFVSMIALDNLDFTSVEAAVVRLKQQAVAGVILVSPQSAMADAFEHLPRDIPTVAIWGYPGTPIPVVASNESVAAYDATCYLIKLGHRGVFHVAGPAGRIGAGERIRGWRRALEEHGIEPSSPPFIANEWSARSGYEQGMRLLAGYPETTAIFAANDQIALGIMRAIAETGRSVPRDVSVVGFDDIPDAAYFAPPLTTVHQHFDELGRKGMTLLLQKIAEEAPPSSVDMVLDAELIIRESAAPPRSK